MTSETPRTIGVLLAGGQSSRMGGGDKSLRTIGQTPILHRVIERMESQCDELVLNANGDPTRFSDYHLPVIRDDLDGFQGPLAGILASLDWVATHRPDTTWVASIATDTPFIPRDLIKSLHKKMLESGSRLACAGSGGWVHPVIGLWPVELRGELRLALTQEGLRKIDLWTARYSVAVCEWPINSYDPFFNANTPDDLIEAESLIASGKID
jgi:molybdenum cofactor guanylyltransferase